MSFYNCQQTFVRPFCFYYFVLYRLICAVFGLRDLQKFPEVAKFKSIYTSFRFGFQISHTAEDIYIYICSTMGYIYSSYLLLWLTLMPLLEYLTPPASFFSNCLIFRNARFIFLHRPSPSHFHSFRNQYPVLPYPTGLEKWWLDAFLSGVNGQ